MIFCWFGGDGGWIMQNKFQNEIATVILEIVQLLQLLCLILGEIEWSMKLISIGIEAILIRIEPFQA